MGGMAKTKKSGKDKGSDKLSKKAVKKEAELSKKQKKEAAKAEAQSWSDVLGVGKGFVLADLDPRSTPGFAGDKAAGEAAKEGLDVPLAELQERLYAESKAGGKRSLLLIVQGMDTSGKGGIMRYVVGAFDPQGVRHTAFKAPTKEELAHDFLWRITNALPKPGEVGAFDRSQYEDVLIVRVHDIVPREVWMKRYAQINAWDQDRQGHAAHLQGRAEGSPHGASGAPRQVLEVQPRRRGRALPLARLHGGLPSRSRQDLDGRGALARRAGRPQVVRPPRRDQPRARGAAGDGPAVAGRDL
jgi:polyphosphate kinase 2 (PPK2 family)